MKVQERYYYQLRVYEGPLTKCEVCGKSFKRGEVFTLLYEGLAFCCSESVDGCLRKFVRQQKLMCLLRADPYVYQAHVPPKRWWQFWKR